MIHTDNMGIQQD